MRFSRLEINGVDYVRAKAIEGEASLLRTLAKVVEFFPNEDPAYTARMIRESADRLDLGAAQGRTIPPGSALDTAEPPHGYMPFLTGGSMGDHEQRWVCATPFCDCVDDLLYQSYDDAWQMDSNELAEPSRIRRTYTSRADAVAGAWDHARRWWGGEPPRVDAIPGYRSLPAGWTIFVGRDHNMWIAGPKPGDGHGKISGSTLSSALQCYADECWRDHGGDAS